jgi:predicted O-methyltransferase YrrM
LVLWDACRGAEVVVELGCRFGHGAALILDALGPDGCLVSVDVEFQLNSRDRQRQADEPVVIVDEDDRRWTRIVGSSLDAGVREDVVARFGEPDVVFMDSKHDAEHVRAELAVWGSSPVVVIHDTRERGVWEPVCEYACSSGAMRDVRMYAGFLGLGVVSGPARQEWPGGRHWSW